MIKRPSSFYSSKYVRVRGVQVSLQKSHPAAVFDHRYRSCSLHFPIFLARMNVLRLKEISTTYTVCRTRRYNTAYAIAAYEPSLERTKSSACSSREIGQGENSPMLPSSLDPWPNGLTTRFLSPKREEIHTWVLILIFVFRTSEKNLHCFLSSEKYFGS